MKALSFSTLCMPVLIVALFVTMTPDTLAGVSPGPVAIAIGKSAEAIILRADGRLYSFDTQRGRNPNEFFRVPSDFVASDVGVVSTADGTMKCLIVNSKRTDKYASFVMQLLPNKKQVWTKLPDRGVYVGIAVESAGKYAYATNSTTNTVYRVELGNERGLVTRVATMPKAEVLASMALDEAGKRLFVADITGGGVFVVNLARKSEPQRIDIPSASEIRAVAWQPAGRRLFVADAGKESVFAIDPERPADSYEVTHRAFKQPSGLALAIDGSLWGVDQGSRTIFQILANQRTAARIVTLD